MRKRAVVPEFAGKAPDRGAPRIKEIVHVANVNEQFDVSQREKDQKQQQLDRSVSQLKVATMFVGLIGVAFAATSCELLVANGYVFNATIHGLKAIQTAMTVLLIALLIVYYQTKLHASKLRGDTDFADTLYSTGMLRLLALEVFLCSLHCPVGVEATFSVSNLGITMTYTLDELLSVIILVRVYLFGRVFDEAMGRSTAQARVISKWNKVGFGFLFSFRAMMEAAPVAFVATVMSITIICLSYAIRVFERPLCREWEGIHERCQPYADSYEHFTTAMWNILITMTTVGYGDIYPVSHGGRAVAIVACFMGVVLVAMLVTGVQSLSKFEPDELRAFNALHRSAGRRRFRAAAARMIRGAWEYYKYRLHTIYGHDVKLIFPIRTKMRVPTAAALARDVRIVEIGEGRTARIPAGYETLLFEVHIWKKARYTFHQVTREKNEFSMVVKEIIDLRSRVNELAEFVASNQLTLNATLAVLREQSLALSAKQGLPLRLQEVEMYPDPALCPHSAKIPVMVQFTPSKEVIDCIVRDRPELAAGFAALSNEPNAQPQIVLGHKRASAYVPTSLPGSLQQSNEASVAASTELRGGSPGQSLAGGEVAARDARAASSPLSVPASEAENEPQATPDQVPTPVAVGATPSVQAVSPREDGVSTTPRKALDEAGGVAAAGATPPPPAESVTGGSDGES
jgi:hypothetical protein